MKFVRPTSLALLSTALTAPSAFAYDFGNGFSLMGDVELEYFDPTGSSPSLTFGFADVTFGWRSQAGGAIGFGFDLTGVAVSDINDGGTFSAFWGGLVLTTAFGEVTVGRPRPLLDTLSPSPDVGAARVYGGVEMVDNGSGEVRKLLLGARYGADRWAMGAEVVNVEGASDRTTVYQLYSDYEVIVGLVIGAQYQDFDDLFGQSIYGVSGIYSMGSGGFAELGYSDVSGADDGVVSASIGFRC